MCSSRASAIRPASQWTETTWLCVTSGISAFARFCTRNVRLVVGFSAHVLALQHKLCQSAAAAKSASKMALRTLLRSLHRTLSLWARLVGCSSRTATITPFASFCQLQVWSLSSVDCSRFYLKEAESFQLSLAMGLLRFRVCQRASLHLNCALLNYVRCRLAAIVQLSSRHRVHCERSTARR